MSPILAAAPAWLEPHLPLVTRAYENFSNHAVLYVTWTGLFAATFLLVRMLYTRWGETNSTAKALGASVLVHLVGGLWTTTVHLASGTPVIAAPERVPIRRVIIESNRDRTPPLERSIPNWERPTVAPREALTRVEKDMRDVPAPTIERSTRPEERMASLTPTLIDRAMPADQPLAERQANRAPDLVEGAKTAIEEETAESRPEALAPAGDRQRSAPNRAGNPAIEIERGARPGATAVATEMAQPKPAVNLPTKAAVAEASRKAAPDETAGQLRKPADVARISPEDAGTMSDATAQEAGQGARTGNPFSRSGSKRPGGAMSGTATDLRKDRSPSAPDGGGVPLVARIGTPLGAPDALPPAAREEMAAVVKVPSRVPATYRLRGAPQRKRVAVEMGATEASEQAVERSLRWLSAFQEPEGYWDADGFPKRSPAGQPVDGAATFGREPPELLQGLSEEQKQVRQRSGLEADTGVTALTTLAFLGAGHTPLDGDYADTVDRALRWLVSQQTEDGFLGGKSGRYARMYCHGMATIALGEAYAMTGDPTLRAPLERAVKFIVDNQLQDGGWRYDGKATVGDMSIFGWQLMALRSAGLTGIPVPAESIQRATGFLQRAGQGQFGGLASYGGYGSDTRVRPTMTAEAQYCRQILRLAEANPQQSREAIGYVMRYPPTPGTTDLYFWYYGTLAVYHHGDRATWQTWNTSMRDSLVADQIKEGPAAGSWEPRYPWGDYGGRVFSTAMSTLCLEVYYRFLPLYQTQMGPSPAPSTPAAK